MKQKLGVAFHGYDGDSRELFEIPEVRAVAVARAGDLMSLDTGCAPKTASPPSARPSRSHQRQEQVGHD